MNEGYATASLIRILTIILGRICHFPSWFNSNLDECEIRISIWSIDLNCFYVHSRTRLQIQMQKVKTSMHSFLSFSHLPHLQ